MKAFSESFAFLSGILTASVIFILSMSPELCAQTDTSSNGNALNFPFKKYGISIGNSIEFNGLRLNFADRNVTRVNGINLTAWMGHYPNNYPIVNGISFGVFPIGSSMRGINVGLGGLIAPKADLDGISIAGIGGGSGKNNNGLAICGIYMIGGGNVNGLSLSGLVSYLDGESSSVSGVTFSGVAVYAGQSVNGISLGGSVISRKINGFSCAVAYLNAKETFRGIGITPGYIKAGNYYGLSVSGYSRTALFHGLSISLYNRTDILHGVQLGIINYAGNNRKGLRILPLINAHLRK